MIFFTIFPEILEKFEAIAVIGTIHATKWLSFTPLPLPGRENMATENFQRIKYCTKKSLIYSLIIKNKHSGSISKVFTDNFPA